MSCRSPRASGYAGIMASAELQRLWKLSQVDAKIVEVRKTAAALDVGKTVLAQIEALKAKDAEVGGNYRSLKTEQTDLELAQKGIEEKLKRIDKELYGGKVVNPREVENFEREIVNLKKQRDHNDERLLELFDLVPPAKDAADKIESQIKAKKVELAEKQKAAIAQKAILEADFAKLNQARPEATRGIPPALMARYDGLRQRNGGIGMAECTKKQTCGHCGTVLPERTLQGLKDDKLITCESCHCILYYTEGVI